MRLAALLVVSLAACAPHEHGTLRADYPSGRPRWQYHVVDGIPNGEGTAWHENGHVRSTGTYVDGDRHGRFRFYDDTGAFDHQAVFLEHVEVWRSTVEAEEPPAGIVKQLGIDRRATAVPPSSEDIGGNMIVASPAPWFGSLDHATMTDRVAIVYGTGDISQLDLFATHEVSGRYGAYAELQQTNAAVSATDTRSFAGRRTFDAGATARFALPAGATLVGRAGLLVPIGNDDREGLFGSSAGAIVMPQTAAAAFPSTVAARTSASVSRSLTAIVLRADAGVDLVLGDQVRPVDPVGRLDAAVGVGVRLVSLTFELSNAMLLAEPSRRLTATAFGGSVWFNGLWFTATLARATTGESQVEVGISRAL